MMLTILEVINLSADYLTRKGIEDPKRNAELLLCKVLNCKRINLYLNFDKPLGENEVNIYRSFLKRRGEREPLQYITGSVEFYGLEFLVSPSVLIPRPETELLVERIIKDYSGENLKILDIGTGSGNIAVTLAKYLPSAEITAIDRSSEALLIAAENEKLNLDSKKIKFLIADIFSDTFPESCGEYDVIVSNPPYVSDIDYGTLEPELRIYEPSIALSDMGDGLSFYRRIIGVSDNILRKPGKIYFEMGKDQSSVIYTIMKENNFKNITILKDYQQIDRIISGEKE
jgi:release factor glutamine methyltransferase